ncbi:MAG: hypothetical protein K2M12_07175, partial [Muribaculaceae bacterium]|nr:hypothetical protein [Muribaculaceae bacterium]
MRPTVILLGAAAIILAAVACSRRSDINGSWTSTPVNMPELAYASTASSVLNIDFEAPKGAKSGPVTLTMVVDATQPVEAGATEGFDAPYEVSVTGRA